MHCLYFSERVRSQTVSLKFLWILLNKGYNMLIYDDIACYEVSVCAWRNWRSVVVVVLAVVIFGKKLVPKSRYGTLWSFLTYGYHKLQLVKNLKQNYCDTILRNMKSHIESMFCIETGGDEKWKPRNSINSDQLCLTSTTHFWKMYRIDGFYDFFLFKSMKST